MSQMESQLSEERMLELLHLGSLEMAKEHRTHRRMAKFHLDRLWWNTLGPGGQTWFGDHLPIRRLVSAPHPPVSIEGTRLQIVRLHRVVPGPK